METDHRDETGAAGGVLSLSQLLNIFYRRRRVVIVLTALGLAAGIAYGIIVRPLYRSTAQVRPGVVAYAADGTPLRHWALEDVVHWFDNRLYWADLKQMPEFSGSGAPIVDAAFIPSLNFVAGGDVITLRNLSRSPERARLALDEAIASFNRQARRDSLGSSLYLTQQELRGLIQRVNLDIERISVDEERARLEIAQYERELELVGLERKSVQLDLAVLANRNTWRLSAVKSLRDEVLATRPRLVEAERLVREVMAQEPGLVEAPDGGDPVTQVLRQTASREQAGRAGELLLTVNHLGRFVADGTMRADSLAAEVKASELEMNRLQNVLDIELAAREADVRQKIRDVEIRIEQDLPNERAVLQADLNTNEIKLAVISPLERVGGITVSEKPVRPRKLRAATILTFLALGGSLLLALVLEYLEINRAAITAERRVG